ncbi:MAG TPA: hypothetical protein V6D17_00750 [Candidatus Obscuribacterales bacterium]
MLVSTQNVQTSMTAGVQAPQQNAVFPGSASDICVYADNEVGLALACLLTQNGHGVRVLTNTPQAQMPREFEVRVRRAGVSSYRGELRFAALESDVEQAMRKSESLVIPGGATECGAVLKQMIPHMRHGQTLCLVNASLGAGLQCAHDARTQRKDLQLNVIEMGNLFDFAKVEENVLLIIGQRENVNICGNSRNETRRGLPVANAFSGGLVPASNVIERGLSDVERILRPTLLLIGIVGGRDESLDNICSLLNPSLISIATSLDAEIQSLAKVFKCVVPTFPQALREFALSHTARCQAAQGSLEDVLLHLGQSLLEQAQAEALSPEAARQVLKRDVAETLVLLSDMGRLSRTPLPILNSIIELASAVLQSDLSKQGRTLSDLGLVGYDVQEIIELVNS